MYGARLLGCEGDGNASVVSGGGVVAVSAYMGGTRGSGVLTSTGDVLEMSVVKGVGGVFDMCMCLARGGGGGEWVLLGEGMWAACARVWEGGVVLCLCML